MKLAFLKLLRQLEIKTTLKCNFNLNNLISLTTLKKTI